MSNYQRRREPEKKGAPAWMTTYADMVTLLLTFFVLLYSFSTVDAQKFRAIISAFQGTLGVLDKGKVISPDISLHDSALDFDTDFMVSQKDIEQIEALMEEMQSLVAAGELPGTVELVHEERGLVVRFADRAFFDLGRADIRPDAQSVMYKIAEILKPLQNHVRIEGHTDNLPIQTERFPSNWELSTARATSVIRFLLEKTEVAPERLSAAGYGEYRPIDSNSTVQGRARNRRVDLVILHLGLSYAEPGGSSREPAEN
ncbi:MAG: flagellar motor protein MotB [Firmicutes bacterium]|nr:flagellar motor protein MotB [Bacillota bacterium]